MHAKANHPILLIGFLGIVLLALCAFCFAPAVLSPILQQQGQLIIDLTTTGDIQNGAAKAEAQRLCNQYLFFQLATPQGTPMTNSESRDLASVAVVKPIFVSSKESSDGFNKLLPADRRATTKSDITGVVCTVEVDTLHDTAKYGPTPRADQYGSLYLGTPLLSFYTCKHYSRAIEVYVFEIKSGRLAMQQSFNGIPDACPKYASGDLEVIDTSPYQDIVNWVLNPTR